MNRQDFGNRISLFGGAPGTETGYGRIGGKYTIEETTFLKTITVNFEKCD